MTPPDRELLLRFKGRSRGFQASGVNSYQKHEEWRKHELRALRRLQGRGLLVIQQLIPCTRHERCGGQPIAAGCELTGAGERMRVQGGELVVPAQAR